jgi:hypothetical protein
MTAQHAVKQVRSKQKEAAGAPTRGGFMMASDIPPFKMPSLRSPIEKNSDMLPEGMTYDPKDFKPVRLVGKEKAADISPAKAWSPGVGGSARQASYLPPFRAPSLLAPIAKLGSTSPFEAAQTAKTVGTFKVGKLPKIPGPSIAQIAKPKGAGFGSGIAGAFKGSIGGSGPVDLSANPGSLKERARRGIRALETRASQKGALRG